MTDQQFVDLLLNQMIIMTVLMETAQDKEVKRLLTEQVEKSNDRIRTMMSQYDRFGA